MPKVRMVDREEVPPSTQAIFDEGEAKYGKVLDAWRVIAHSPQVFEAYLPFTQAVFGPGELDARAKQLSALRVTLLNHCRYSLSHRVAAARKQGMSDEDLIAVAQLGESRDHFTDEELAALDFTDELTTRVDDVTYQEDPLGVSAGTMERVLNHFSEREIVELTMSVGLWNLLTRFLRVMDFDLDMPAPPAEMEAVL